MKIILTILLLVPAMWGQKNPHVCPKGDTVLTRSFCLKLDPAAKTYAYEDSFWDQLKQPPILERKDSITLKNGVEIPLDIKYCDQISGKDAGSECVRRERKHLSRIVVGPSKPIAPIRTSGKCHAWKMEMKGVQSSDHLLAAFVDDPSRKKGWRDGALNVSVEAVPDAFWFSVCNPTPKPITPDVIEFMVVDIDRNMP